MHLYVVLLFVLYFFSVPTLQQGSLNVSVAPPIFAPSNHPKVNATNKIKLGVLGIAGQQLDAIKVAADFLNYKTDILPDTSIEIYAYTSAVESDVLFSSMYFAYNMKVHGFIGASTSSLSKTGQTIAKINRIPQIASNAIAGSLSNKLDFPYFTRTISADVDQVGAVLELFQKYGWKQAVVVYTNDEYGLGYSQLLLKGSALNISFYATGISASGTKASDFISTGETLKSYAEANGYRIFVVWGTTAAHFALQAFNITGLLGQPDTTWIVTGNLVDALRGPTNALLLTGKLDGSMGFGYGLPGGAVYDDALNFWNNKANVTKWTGVQIPPWYYFDAVLSFGYAFDNLLKAGAPFSNISGPTLLAQIKSQVYEGTTGTVRMNANGDRLGGYELWNFRNTTGYHIGRYSLTDQNLTQWDDLEFMNGTLKAPRDRPYTCAQCVHGICVEDQGCVCALRYTGAACDVLITEAGDKGIAIVVWLPAVVGAVAIVFLGGFLWYRRSRRILVRQVAEKQKSIIERQDLTLSNRIGRGASGEVWKGSFRGTEIAVKKIITNHVDNAIIESFEMEVAMMCGLRHPNIILFMGSCFDRAENEMLLVMEFMARGSLNDVLNNNKIPLSHEMKIHLATQAAQGMNFLHQSNPPTIHHDLKSHNILLDDKWNARISDFGIAKFKETSNKANERSNSVGTIYWSAPEVLEGKPSTEKCDCYSFGIVLWEIWHRQMPFAGRDPVAVAVEVIRSGLRPPISTDVPQEVAVLMRSCWAQNSAERPAFQEIMTTLRQMSIVSPLQDYGGSTRIDAPTGQVYLISTNVLGAFALWDLLPRDMETAMLLHNQTIRNNIDTFHGYEVSFDKHSFTGAFSTLDDACNFAIAVQVALLHMEWPSALLQQPICAPVYGEPNNTLLWKGLRVRIAISCGVPNCEIDAQSGRMTYFGPVMDKLSKLTNVNNPSAILIDALVAEHINKKRPRLIQEFTSSKIADIKGDEVHKITIQSLLGRSNSFSSGEVGRNNDSILPHVVVAINSTDDLLDEDEIILPQEFTRPVSASAINSQLNKPVSWIANHSDIEIKQVIGKGHIGDYYQGRWNGKEVAVKVLVNQKLKETDVFKLIGDSVYMNKLYNANILPLYGVCIDPDHLTILSEYMAKGNLKMMLADSSVQLNFSKKVTIALGIAQGMAFLSALPDACMQIHDNLKSNNVLIGKNWEVKVADYGHSNIRELARTMTSVGNIAWTAPEILGGGAVTPKIAVYSFGIILWELYTRQVPYTNEHPIKVVNRILQGYRPTIPADCPAPYRSLLEACVREDARDRPEWNDIIGQLSSMNN